MSCTICSLLGPWWGRDEGQAACTARDTQPVAAAGTSRAQGVQGTLLSSAWRSLGAPWTPPSPPEVTGPRGTP